MAENVPTILNVRRDRISVSRAEGKVQLDLAFACETPEEQKQRWFLPPAAAKAIGRAMFKEAVEAEKVGPVARRRDSDVLKDAQALIRYVQQQSLPLPAKVALEGARRALVEAIHTLAGFEPPEGL